MKTVLITSGGTREYIDDVRIITNISSGKLGAMLADEFHYNGWRIIHVAAKYSVIPHIASELPDEEYKLIEVNTAIEAEQAIKDNVGQADAVIHAMAVSDFGCKTDNPIKLKSNDLDAFIDHLRDNMFVNPKILPKIKKWNPNTFLVSFKFEVGKTHDELMQIAIDSMTKANADAVVANDKMEMMQNKSHVAYLIDALDTSVHLRCSDKDEIVKELLEMLTALGVGMSDFGARMIEN